MIDAAGITLDEALKRCHETTASGRLHCSDGIEDRKQYEGCIKWNIDSKIGPNTTHCPHGTKGDIICCICKTRLVIAPEILLDLQTIGLIR